MSSSSNTVRHVRKSKVKYAPGTVVLTERGRRAQVQADGRWRWLPKLISDSKQNSNSISSSSSDSQEPLQKRRKLERKASQREIKVDDVKENKESKPKRKRKIKTSPIPQSANEPPQGNDAFSRAASETERKGKKQKGRAGWLARWFP